VPEPAIKLRVAEQVFRSDTGRQRDANEDAYFAGDPVFAVADGMGGAQAGEVASRIAAEAFEPVERGEASPEAYLRGIAEEANERIHSLAQADSAHSGMGTTFTAAIVEGEEVSLAHVGDSRAYLLRDDELKLLTSDHSLVEELRRQGRLTDEQAEDHPQRSIITRALGPEAEVEVDTMTYRARPGDVYLLCSDGLTTMVKDERIREILTESGSLADAADRLIDDANAAGGRDNITVVAFRLEDADAVVDGAGEPPAGATLVGPAAEETAADVRAAQRARERERARDGAEPGRRRSRSRTALKVLVPLLILAAVIAGAVYAARQIYFLGSDEGGRLALYRGLPYDLPLGIKLYSEVYSTPVQVSSLPAARQDSATDHKLRSHDDVVSLIDDLEGSAKPPAGPSGSRGLTQPSGGGGGGQPPSGGNGGGGGSGGGGSSAQGGTGPAQSGGGRSNRSGGG
jgi:protein phosphatase